jgi:hypothetical protein
MVTSFAKSYLVRASYLEIYNENIRDLLSKNPDTKLDLKENPETGVYVKVKYLQINIIIVKIGSIGICSQKRERN